MTFDPNATGTNTSNIFALPFTEEQSKLVLLPVPWEVTTSYGHGTSIGPRGIFEASKQLDLCDSLYGEFYQQGIFMRPTDEKWLNRSKLLKEKALYLRDKIENDEDFEPEDLTSRDEINQASLELNQWVYEQSKEVIANNKVPSVVGGDHSSPFGIIKAYKEKYDDLSILHIDAHHDLRVAYQSYTHSHASIMYNVMKELKPSSLVQMGIRDFCPQEQEMAFDDQRIHTFYDSKVSLELAAGKTWLEVIDEAIGRLTGHVYISFDIDGLDPSLCPNTGTPVPGGLSFQQAEILLYRLSQSGKKIVGFDLCEVSPESEFDLDGWDTNLGARILFKLCGCLLSCQN